MRKNVLPHFINRDARDIIRFEGTGGGAAGTRFLSDALRASVLLSETSAILPPGHFLESDVAYDVITSHRALLDAGLIEMPMRETNLLDLIEKKRSEYGSVRHQFPGLFDDQRMRLFEDVTPFFTPRTTRIGLAATSRWEEGPDTNPEWDVLTTLLPGAAIDLLRSGPKRLLESGEALTWPALFPHLDEEVLGSSVPVRVVLQKNYFRLYIDEYRAAFLSDLPYGFDVYLSSDDDRYYSYQGLVQVLSALRCGGLLRLPVEGLIRLKASSGWTAFADVFVQMVAGADTQTNVSAAFSRAAADVGLGGLLLQSEAVEYMPAGRVLAAVNELSESLASLSARLTADYSLIVRTAIEPAPGSPVTPSRFRPEGNTQVHTSRAPGESRQPMNRVLIATSNERETKAVHGALVAEVGEDAVVFDSEGAVARFTAVLPTKKGQVVVDLGLAHETGGDEAVDLMRRYVSAEHPGAVFFVGCSGLLDERYPVEPGTVFVAKRAIDADKRKITDSGVEYDGDLFHGDNTLRTQVTLLKSAGTFDPINVVTNRDFISGGAFHQSRASQERKDFVRSFPPDAVVMEMEAYAVYKEVARMRERGRQISALVVKGISDLGDEQAQEGKETTQAMATGNAARVVLTLLREVGG